MNQQQPMQPFNGGHIQGDRIYGYTLDDYAKARPVHIGFTGNALSAVKADLEEAGSKAEGYYDLLTQERDCPACGARIPGIITPEPTPDQISQQQAQQLSATMAQLTAATSIIQQMQEAMIALTAEVKELKESLRVQNSIASESDPRNQAGNGGTHKKGVGPSAGVQPK